MAIEALGTQATFESALRVLRRGRNAIELRRLFGKALDAGRAVCGRLGDQKIVTTLCPGGKERMRRLMELVRHGKLDLRRC